MSSCGKAVLCRRDDGKVLDTWPCREMRWEFMVARHHRDALGDANADTIACRSYSICPVMAVMAA